MRSFEIDLAIVEGQMEGQGLYSVLLDTDYLCLAVSPQHPLAKRQRVSLQELRQENFILRPEGAGTRSLFENHLLSHSENIRNFNVIIELDNVSVIKELVASNLGVTVISHKVCRQEIAFGKLVVVPIENLSMTREVNLVYPQEFAHPQILEELRAIYDSKA